MVTVMQGKARAWVAHTEIVRDDMDDFGGATFRATVTVLDKGTQGTVFHAWGEDCVSRSAAVEEAKVLLEVAWAHAKLRGMVARVVGREFVG